MAKYENIAELLRINKVCFVSFEDYKKRLSSITGFAKYYGVEITTTKGFFINTQTGETEQLIKVEIKGELRDSQRMKSFKKAEKMKQLKDEGMTLEEIGKIFKCTKQAVSALIKKYEG